VIVDASVWIDYQRGGRSVATLHLRSALHNRQLINLTPTILQEVLQGAATPEQFAVWLRLFRTFPCLAVEDPARTAMEAANLYARCRWSGVTPRSSNDCLIAVTCIELAQPLLHNDADFDRIARIDSRLRVPKPLAKIH
jgi:predicted nucleic acid-binding protein